VSAASAAAAAPLARPPFARRAGRLLARVIGGAVVGVLLGVVVVVLVLPLVTGGSVRAVRSGSMQPALPTGSLVLDRPVAANTLRVGDIATYVRSDHEFVTHRIAAIRHSAKGESFTFRGDANRSSDPEPVPAADVRGKVWLHLPLLGGIGLRLAHAKWVLIGIAVVALAAYAVRQAAGGLRELRRDR
jgi:signal peptidase I